MKMLHECRAKHALWVILAPKCDADTHFFKPGLRNDKCQAKFGHTSQIFKHKISMTSCHPIQNRVFGVERHVLKLRHHVYSRQHTPHDLTCYSLS